MPRVIPMLAAAACCLGLVAAEAAKEDFSKEAIPGGFKTISEKDYTVQCPADWQMQRVADALVLVAPKDGQDQPSLNIQSIAGGVAELDDMARNVEEAIKRNMKNVRVLVSRPAAFGGRAAHHFAYTADFAGMPTRITQLIIRDASRTYILTFSVRPEKHEKYWPTIRQIIASLRPAATP